MCRGRGEGGGGVVGNISDKVAERFGACLSVPGRSWPREVEGERAPWILGPARHSVLSVHPNLHPSSCQRKFPA